MFHVFRKLLWKYSMWSAMALYWQNSDGVSFGSGISSWVAGGVAVPDTMAARCIGPSGTVLIGKRLFVNGLDGD